MGDVVTQNLAEGSDDNWGQARKQDFVWEGSTCRGPEVPRTQNRKFPGFALLFLGSGQCIFHFLIFAINFNLFFRSGGMAYMPLPPWLRP